jgi:hypothetical protein
MGVLVQFCEEHGSKESSRFDVVSKSKLPEAVRHFFGGSLSSSYTKGTKMSFETIFWGFSGVYGLM